MENCLFCKIVSGDIPSARVYEDAAVIAFSDIDPQAPVHVLIVPKKHVESADVLTDADTPLLAAMFAAARAIAKQYNLSENGYRLVQNIGRDGGQSVPHLHMHLLGGRSLQWPPG